MRGKVPRRDRYVRRGLGEDLRCNVRCVDGGTQTQCRNGDGCCPGNCNATNDGDCQPRCNNNVREAGETCDGNCPTSCPPQNCQNRRLENPGTCRAQCVNAGAIQCTGCDECRDNRCQSKCNGATQHCEGTRCVANCMGGEDCQPSNRCKTGIEQCDSGGNLSCREMGNKPENSSCGGGACCGGDCEPLRAPMSERCGQDAIDACNAVGGGCIVVQGSECKRRVCITGGFPGCNSPFLATSACSAFTRVNPGSVAPGSQGECLITVASIAPVSGCQ